MFKTSRYFLALQSIPHLIASFLWSTRSYTIESLVITLNRGKIRDRYCRRSPFSAWCQRVRRKFRPKRCYRHFQTLYFLFNRKVATTSQILRKLPCVAFQATSFSWPTLSSTTTIDQWARENLSPREIFFLHKKGLYNHNQVVFAFFTTCGLKYHDTYSLHLKLYLEGIFIHTMPDKLPI